jgi:hypothetical protein
MYCLPSLPSVISRLTSALFLACICAGQVIASPLPPNARSEVVTLLHRLEASGCQFNRNGTWYTAAEAKTHLLRKLDYVEKNATLATAEAFIEAAATRSSMSGLAYQVRCDKAQAQPSAAWLLHELQLQRQPAKP